MSGTHRETKGYNVGNDCSCWQRPFTKGKIAAALSKIALSEVNFSHSAVKCFSLPAILVEQIFGKFGKEVSERLLTFTGVTVLVWSSLFSGEE